MATRVTVLLLGGFECHSSPSGVMHCIHANMLEDLVTDWCVKKKVPDTQFGFYPGRSTLHPLFIFRYLKHATKKIKPQQSPRLHAAFINFSQAYDTVPRLQPWDHLQRIVMPAPLLQAIKEMYQDDEYILINGDERARVYPTMELSKVSLQGQKIH
eukprot:1155872-Pelagomonas_calceolata.AAC.2